MIGEITRHHGPRPRASVVGLLNIQFAIKDGTLYVLEVNPRAAHGALCSAPRTAAGQDRGEVCWALACGVRPRKEKGPSHISVKEAVLPFNKFPGPIRPHPEMKSTGR